VLQREPCCASLSDIRTPTVKHPYLSISSSNSNKPTAFITSHISNMRVSALLLVVFGLPAFATLLDTQFPHMLLPLKKSQPDTAFPTQNNATVSYDVRVNKNTHTHAIVWIILTSTRTDPLMSNGQPSTTMSLTTPQISVASDSSSTLTPLRMLRSASKVKHLSPSTSHASNPSLSTAALPGTTSQP
jgi:hypothetical protein